MRNPSSASLPTLQADLLLLHAPAFYDFRDRGDIYFPFLGTSGDVPITPLYEYFPVGFKTLQRFLGQRDFDVKLINLSTVLLRYPHVRVEDLIDALDVELVGIDLHWMVHVQGSLAIAKLIKERRPELKVIFGGISSTYYAQELIRYPFIDMVMRGYDTHEPMATLLAALKRGGGLEAVPNLLWKSGDQTVHDNGLAYLPSSYSCGIDWSRQPRMTSSKTLPILEVLSTQNAGCAYNCPWCGGSREAFRRIYGRKNTMARKPQEEIRWEIGTTNELPDVAQYHFYSIGSYNESPQGMAFFLDRIAESQFKSVSYEQFHLTPDHVLQRMAQANPRTVITLSPESHDVRISKLCGRGVYTNDQLERWIARAFEYGIFQIDVWYFVGMPEQDQSSVAQTVEYCRRLLELFKGQRLNPMICPMIPFLDPASTFFEDPARHGYRIFHRSVEEHRRGMERASVLNRINYETRWLSRRDLVRVGFDAVKQLMDAKAVTGQLPRSWVKTYNARVDDALEFIPVVHEADCIPDPKARAEELARLQGDIRRRNDQIFCAGVLNQAFPVNREIGGRWFDELGWDPQLLEASGAFARN